MFRFVLLGLLLALLPALQVRADDEDQPAYDYSNCSAGDEVVSPRPQLNGKDICILQNLHCTRTSTTDRNNSGRFKDITAVCLPNRSGRCPESDDCANSTDISSDQFCKIQMGTLSSSERQDRRDNSCSGSDSDNRRVNPLCDNSDRSSHNGDAYSGAVRNRQGATTTQPASRTKDVR